MNPLNSAYLKEMASGLAAAFAFLAGVVDPEAKGLSGFASVTTGDWLQLPVFVLGAFGITAAAGAVLSNASQKAVKADSSASQGEGGPEAH